MAADNNSSFSDRKLGLDNRLIKACYNAGFTNPSVVQQKCISLLLKGKDLIVKARTGSGKTAAYALPLLQKILTKNEMTRTKIHSTKGIILVPTKELCIQVKRQLYELMRYCRNEISVVAVVGTDDNLETSRVNEKPDILIATPARLVNILEKAKKAKLNETVDTLVIDEADLVLNYGHEEDVKRITSILPKSCQVILLSATLSSEISRIKHVVFNNPEKVEVEEHVEAGKLAQFYLPIKDDSDRFLFVYAIIKLGLLSGKGLFFVNTTYSAYRLKLFFEHFFIRSAVLNAELPLETRMHIIDEFNRGIFKFLIATDFGINNTGSSNAVRSRTDETTSERKRETKSKVPEQKEKKMKSDIESSASRGVDFKAVNFVFNVDFPFNVKSYIHRIGRTSRGGMNGTSLTLCCSNSSKDLNLLRQIQTIQPKMKNMASSDMLINQMGLSKNYEESSQAVEQPALLNFQASEIEQFRYRVDDVMTKIVRKRIDYARNATFLKELVNCKELEVHFKNNPNELKILKHDSEALDRVEKLEHLKLIPSYLLPSGMSLGEDPSKSTDTMRRKANRNPKHLRKGRKRGGDRNRGHSTKKVSAKKVDPLVAKRSGRKRR